MATKIILRETKSSDCSEIIDMINELAHHLNNPNSVVQIDEKKIREDGFGENSWFQSFIAEEISNDPDNKSKKVIGQALYFRTYCTLKGRSLKIEDIYVRPEYRGRGVGSMLLKEVSKQALKENCYKVEWCVLHNDEPALNFYKHIGGEIQPEWRVCYLQGGET